MLPLRLIKASRHQRCRALMFCVVVGFFCFFSRCSETSFHIFIAMASRRIEADRFFTSDFNAEVRCLALPPACGAPTAFVLVVKVNTSRLYLYTGFTSMEHTTCPLSKWWNPLTNQPFLFTPLDYLCYNIQQCVAFCVLWWFCITTASVKLGQDFTHWYSTGGRERCI